jgi:hypothetical protein
MLSPTESNIAFRLIFAYQHQSHMLDNSERFGEVTGLSTACNAETLDMVRGVIECLHNGKSTSRDRLSEPLENTC